MTFIGAMNGESIVVAVEVAGNDVIVADGFLCLFAILDLLMSRFLAADGAISSFLSFHFYVVFY